MGVDIRSRPFLICVHYYRQECNYDVGNYVLPRNILNFDAVRPCDVYFQAISLCFLVILSVIIFDLL